MTLHAIIGDTGLSLPSFGSISTWTLSLLTLIFIGLLAGWLSYYLSKKRSFNKTIHIFEEVSGATNPVRIDKAREIVLPFTSVRAFLLLKSKIYLPRPSIQTGKGHYWYMIRNDGEWVNTRPIFNERTGEMDLQVDHSDMRMANASLKKLVEKNYKKTNWLKEYAPYIGFLAIIMMLGIAGFLFFREAGIVTGGLSSTAERLAETIDALNGILNSVDNIASTSGTVTV